MNLAITLLVIIAIASVIGTVLQQNLPYPDYVIKFGPFWFEMFDTLGLYDVYSALWFLLILGFLLVSTSVCVYRNGPSMIRDMRSFRENVAERSLRAFRHRMVWEFPQGTGAVARTVTAHLTSHGYNLRAKQHGDHVLLAAKKGSANRLGYLFTHIAIVVICVGALLDGNLPLKLAEMTGKVEVETRTLLTSQVPEESRLSPDNSSFRGLVTIPEGSAARHVDIGMRDGYLLQELPFIVEVEEFRIEHYENGQPKSFESDLVIYDEGLARPLRQTIAVNHPLVYKGYAIYQASFSDGGSELKMRAWPLSESSEAGKVVEVEVGREAQLNSFEGSLTLEVDDFRLHNVKPAPPDSGEKFRDLGPSVVFKLRDAKGTALEYENYMLPVEQDGQFFIVSGMRDDPNVEFSYLRIPMGADGGVERFMHFLALVQDKEKVREVAVRTAMESLQGTELQNPEVRNALISVMERLLEQFGDGGFEAVGRYIQGNLSGTMPVAQREQAASAYAGLLEQALGLLYGDVLAQESAQAPARSVNVDSGNANDEQRAQFFNDAVNAIGVIAQYGSPYYLELVDFEHIQASGLQITRAPGQNVVYIGFGMLIIGVFLMFYLPHRRLWVWIKPNNGQTSVLFAGGSDRDQLGFTKEFNSLQSSLEARLKATHPDSSAGI